MTVTERIEAFWSGERPDEIPFTIYHNEWRHTAGDVSWFGLLHQGLGVVVHLPTWKSQFADGIEHIVTKYTENNHVMEHRKIKTPIGEIEEILMDGWRQKFFLKSAKDYAVMTYIVRNTRVVPDYGTFIRKESQMKPYGIPLVELGRTPNQVILVDMAGLENYSYHLVELSFEMHELYEALLVSYRKKAEIVAAGPGRFVSVLENFTAETLGPDRYNELLLPVYQEIFPWLKSSGKIIGTHYDGKLSSCRDVIAGAPIDVIESLTPPPEGDMTLAECRAAWPDKLFWSNINVDCYNLPASKLEQTVLERVAQAAPDGRGLAFEISEQYPANWIVSIPVVLKALKKTRKI